MSNKIDKFELQQDLLSVSQILTSSDLFDEEVSQIAESALNIITDKVSPIDNQPKGEPKNGVVVVEEAIKPQEPPKGRYLGKARSKQELEREKITLQEGDVFEFDWDTIILNPDDRRKLIEEIQLRTTIIGDDNEIHTKSEEEILGRYKYAVLRKDGKRLVWNYSKENPLEIKTEENVTIYGSRSLYKDLFGVKDKDGNLIQKGITNGSISLTKDAIVGFATKDRNDDYTLDDIIIQASIALGDIPEGSITHIPKSGKIPASFLLDKVPSVEVFDKALKNRDVATIVSFFKNYPEEIENFNKLKKGFSLVAQTSEGLTDLMYQVIANKTISLQESQLGIISENLGAIKKYKELVDILDNEEQSVKALKALALTDGELVGVHKTIKEKKDNLQRLLSMAQLSVDQSLINILKSLESEIKSDVNTYNSILKERYGDGNEKYISYKKNFEEYNNLLPLIQSISGIENEVNRLLAYNRSLNTGNLEQLEKQNKQIGLLSAQAGNMFERAGQRIVVSMLNFFDDSRSLLALSTGDLDGVRELTKISELRSRLIYIAPRIERGVNGELYTINWAINRANDVLDSSASIASNIILTAFTGPFVGIISNQLARMVTQRIIAAIPMGVSSAGSGIREALSARGKSFGQMLNDNEISEVAVFTGSMEILSEMIFSDKLNMAKLFNATAITNITTAARTGNVTAAIKYIIAPLKNSGEAALVQMGEQGIEELAALLGTSFHRMLLAERKGDEYFDVPTPRELLNAPAVGAIIGKAMSIPSLSVGAFKTITRGVTLPIQGYGVHLAKLGLQDGSTYVNTQLYLSTLLQSDEVTPEDKVKIESLINSSNEALRTITKMPNLSNGQLFKYLQLKQQKDLVSSILKQGLNEEGETLSSEEIDELNKTSSQIDTQISAIPDMGVELDKEFADITKVLTGDIATVLGIDADPMALRVKEAELLAKVKANPELGIAESDVVQLFDGSLPYVIMTPDNRNGRPQSEEQNQSQRDAFKEKLNELGIEYKEIIGSYENPQTSFILLGVDKTKGAELANQFQQESYIVSDRESGMSLEYLDGTSSKIHNYEVDIDRSNNDGFSIIPTVRADGSIGSMSFKFTTEGKAVTFTTPSEAKQAIKLTNNARIQYAYNQAAKVSQALNNLGVETEVTIHHDSASFNAAGKGRTVQVGDEVVEVNANNARAFVTKDKGKVKIHVNSGTITKSTIAHEGLHPIMDAVYVHIADQLNKSGKPKDDGTPYTIEDAKDAMVAQIDSIVGRVKGIGKNKSLSTLASLGGSVIQFLGLKNKELTSTEKDEYIVEFLSRVQTGDISLKELSRGLRGVVTSFMDSIKEVFGIKRKTTVGNIADTAKTLLEIIKSPEAGRRFSEEISIRNRIDAEVKAQPIKLKADTSTDAFTKNFGELRKVINSIAKGYDYGFIQGLSEGKTIGRETINQRIKSQEANRKQALEFMRTILKDALAQGKLPPDSYKRTLEVIENKLNKVKTPKGIYNVLGYFTKILNDLEYQKKLDDAHRVKDRVKAAIKGKSYEKSRNVIDYVNAFLKIDPNIVADIDRYNDIANKILSIASGVRAKIDKEGDVAIHFGDYEISSEEIDRYIDEVNEDIERKFREDISETLQMLIDADVIDDGQLTTEELVDILNLIEGTPTKDTSDELEKTEQNKRKVQAIKNFAIAKKFELDSYVDMKEAAGEPVSDIVKNIIKNIKGLDINQLTLKETLKFIDVVNNLVTNDSIVGAGQIETLAIKQANIKEALDIIDKMKKKGFNFGDVGQLSERLLSPQLMHEWIFLSTKVAAKIQTLSGANEIMNGLARATVLQDKTMKEFEEYKKKMRWKDVDSAINRFRRGVLADLENFFEGSTEQEIAEEFARRINWIQGSIRNLIESTDEIENRRGELYQQVYDEIVAGSKDATEVRQKLANININNVKIVDWWRAKKAERRETTRHSAEFYNNFAWEDIGMYTTTKVRRVKAENISQPQETSYDMFQEESYDDRLRLIPSGSKRKKTRMANIPQRGYLDFDFDRVQALGYYETNYDVETSKGMALARAFFEDPLSSQVFGSFKNKSIVKNDLRKTVEAQRGRNKEISEMLKTTLRFLNFSQAKATRIALGSLSQTVKQSVPLMFNTMINLGPDMGLFLKASLVGTKINLFEEYLIAVRGSTGGGFIKQADVSSPDELLLGGTVKSFIEKYERFNQSISEKMMTPLVWSDVKIARVSWLAFYMQYLKDKHGVGYINNIDWSTAHLNKNDDAAAYAEQMVSRNQNVNHPSLSAISMRGGVGSDGKASILKNVFMPFSSFSFNMRGRMTVDAKKYLYAEYGGTDFDEATRSLFAGAVEQFIFNSIKGLFIAAYSSFGAGAIAKGLEFLDDEEEEALEKERRTIIVHKKTGTPIVDIDNRWLYITTNTISDFFFSGAGTIPQEGLQSLTNKLYDHMFAAYNEDGMLRKNYKPFFEVSEKGLIDRLGMYSIPFSLGVNVYEKGHMSLSNTHPYVQNSGRFDQEITTIELTKEERNAAVLSTIIDALGMVGIPEDFLKINRDFWKIFKNHMENKAGGRKLPQRFTTGKEGKQEVSETKPPKRIEDFVQEINSKQQVPSQAPIVPMSQAEHHLETKKEFNAYQYSLDKAAKALQQGKQQSYQDAIKKANKNYQELMKARDLRNKK